MVIACTGDAPSAPNDEPRPDTTPPLVQLGLSVNSVIHRGTAVLLVVDARDSAGVGYVEFLVRPPGGSLSSFATDSTAPYQVQYPNATFTAAENGEYQFVARAFDRAGNVGTSNTANLTVAIDPTPPFIQLVPSGTKVTTPGRLVIVANTNAVRLELYDNEVKVAETSITSIPQLFTLSFTAADNGIHVYTCKAYIDEIVSTSAPVTVLADIRWEWAQTLDRSIPRAVALDGSGGVFVAGELRDVFGRPDAFIARYDDTGIRWLRTLGDSLRETALGVAVETNGDVYVAGDMSVWSSGSPPILEDQSFLAKYDAMGNLVWTRHVASPVSELRGYVATDGAGGVYLTGVTWGAVDGNVNTGRQDVFVTKFDRAGTKMWTRQFGSAGGFADDVVTGIAADSARDAVYIVGFTNGSFGGPGGGLFLAKYDRNGNRLWVQQLGASDLDQGTGVAVGPGGEIYVSGTNRGGLDGGPVTTATDILLAKYDPSGTLMWARQLSSTVIYVGPSYDYGNAVATDANGVYLTGMTTGNLDDNSYQGFSDLILVKYDRDGQLLWTRTLGPQAGDEGLGLASDGLGSVYVTGYVDPGAPGPIGVTAKHRDPP